MVWRSQCRFLRTFACFTEGKEDGGWRENEKWHGVSYYTPSLMNLDITACMFLTLSLREQVRCLYTMYLSIAVVLLRLKFISLFCL